MKVLMYAVRPDEKEAIEKYGKEFGLDITTKSENFSKDTAHFSKGYDAISILGNCIADNEALNILKENNVLAIANRSAGYDKIDLDTAHKLGIQVSNVPSYSPNAISEFAVFSAMMLTRNYKLMLDKTKHYDYSLKGLIGFEIRKSTVGIIGTGRIGYEAAKSFKGIGAKVIGYDIYENDKAKEILTYVDLETLLKESDVISLHAPLTNDNKYLINKESLKLVKPTSVIVNTSRGGLVNSRDILEALKNKELAGYAMDVYENEIGIFHIDRSNNPITDEIFLELTKQPNVLVTPHYAFYTTEAVANMVETALFNLKEFRDTGKVVNSL